MSDPRAPIRVKRLFESIGNPAPAGRRTAWHEHRAVIVEACRVFDEVSRQDLAVLIGRKVCTVSTLVAELIEEGLLETRGSNPRDRRYALTEHGKARAESWGRAPSAPKPTHPTQPEVSAT